jgi:hypothetical protein
MCSPVTSRNSVTPRALTGTALHVEVDGVNVSGELVVPNTGSWSSFTAASKTGIALTAGKHVVRIVSDAQWFDFNSFRFDLTSASTSADGGATGTDAGATSSRIFMSDFGGTVAISTPTLSGSSGWWPIVGSDDGYSWPITMNGKASPGLQPIAHSSLAYNSNTKTIDAPLGTPMFGAQIVSGTRHDGTTGPMLYQAEYQSFDGVMQLPYIVSPGSDVTDFYIKENLKFGPNTLCQMGPNAWSTFAEVKDSGYTSCGDGGFRIAIYVMTDSQSNGFWDIHADDCAQGPFFWEHTSRTTVPVGEWFQFEWAWHRTHDASSFTWVKINGNTIMQQNGGGTMPGFYGTKTFPINRIFFGQLYGSGARSFANPFEHWIDHVEIWNAIP